jgi:hypothetical protein
MFKKSKLFRVSFKNKQEQVIAERVAKFFGCKPVKNFRKEGNIIYL